MKRYTRNISKIIIFLLVFVLISTPITITKAEKNNSKNNSYNIEVVVDASGSLKKSDSEGNRYTAIDIFLQTLRENGNNVGTVVFTEDVEVDTGLSTMDTKNSKNALSKKIKSVKADKGDTNIGLALETAVGRLEEMDNGLDSIILLISDGNTDLGSATKNEESIAKEDRAVQNCISNGIPVYGICLNHDKSADIKEFEDISGKTNGAFLEVKSSQNLVKALKDFYAQIFNTEFITDTKKIGSDGKVTKSIEVPAYGVEELNITIDNASKISNITLTKPNGVDLSKNEFSGISSEIDNYYFIKVTNPEAGTWKVEVSGKKGTEITFDYVFNTDNKVGLASNTKNNTFSVGEDVELSSGFYDNGKKLVGKNYYKGYKGTLVVNLKDTGNENPQYYPMKSKGKDGFVYSLSYDEEGVYEVYAVLSCGEFEAKSDPLTFSVGNEAPAFNEGKEKTVTINIKKLFGGSKEIDISKYFTDKEGSKLTYSVLASTYDNGDFSLQDKIVVLSNLTEGQFTIEARDANGGTTTGVFKVKITNVLFIILGAIVAIIAIVGIIILRNQRLKTIMFFDGYLNVYSTSQVDDSNSTPLYAFKGKVDLAEFGLQGHQFGNDVYFKVMKDSTVKGNGSHKLQLVSSKPFYYQASEGELKVTKLNLDLNMSYDIRSHSMDDFDAIDDSICISLDEM